jgi:predicted acylesterase/phospholipase RssA
MAAFKIGINMAGAISAGAYTAGVLDFLTEALDEWYQAKSRGEAVPSHDVSIEVLSGASAGGMCAAISAVMLQEDFEHIHDTTRLNTNNRFYESWVNKIDIRELLKTDDLKHAPPVVSLLDSTIINEIASFALTPGVPSPRSYVSGNLTLFLSLTNLRGIPYSLNGAAPGSIEETTMFFGDRIRFQTLSQNHASVPGGFAYPLDFTKPGPAGGWDILQTAAMATGAFPIFLAPRVLNRKFCEFTPPLWESVTSAATGTPPPVPPNFPQGLAEPMVTLNVDGGVTNNDPFNYAHDYLAALMPSSPGADDLISGPADVDRAVIGIAPFPTEEKFDVGFNAQQRASILSTLPRLFSALISQSRFFGESLNEIMNGTTFSRFVIAPSDPELVAEHEKKKTAASPSGQPAALQCAVLGAFGGFFERKFRAHDYALGRRNCQKFLRDSFVLPADNVIMKPALDSLPPDIRTAVVARFKRPAPGAYAGPEAGREQAASEGPVRSSAVWLPVIPLCAESVSNSIPPVARAQMAGADVRIVVDLILQRFGALVPLLLGLIPSMPLRLFLRVGQPFIRGLARGPLRNALIKQLGDSYRP